MIYDGSVRKYILLRSILLLRVREWSRSALGTIHVLPRGRRISRNETTVTNREGAMSRYSTCPYMLVRSILLCTVLSAARFKTAGQRGNEQGGVRERVLIMLLLAVSRSNHGRTTTSSNCTQQNTKGQKRQTNHLGHGSRPNHLRLLVDSFETIFLASPDKSAASRWTCMCSLLLKMEEGLGRQRGSIPGTFHH